MQSSMQTFKATTAPRGVASRAGRRAAAPIAICQQGLIKEVAKATGAAALAVSLVLVSGGPVGCRSTGCGPGGGSSPVLRLAAARRTAVPALWAGAHTAVRRAAAACNAAG